MVNSGSESDRESNSLTMGGREDTERREGRGGNEASLTSTFPLPVKRQKTQLFFGNQWQNNQLN